MRLHFPTHGVSALVPRSSLVDLRWTSVIPLGPLILVSRQDLRPNLTNALPGFAGKLVWDMEYGLTDG